MNDKTNKIQDKAIRNSAWHIKNVYGEAFKEGHKEGCLDGFEEGYDGGFTDGFCAGVEWYSVRKNIKYERDNRKQRIMNMFDEIEKTTQTLLGRAQYEAIIGWVEQGVEPEVISSAFSYSIEKGKNNIRYVEALVKGATIYEIRGRKKG